MPDREFSFISAADGMKIEAYAWQPDAAPSMIVVIAHGAAEHAMRYERFARALNAAGIEAWAHDHRGHGKTAGLDRRGDFGEGGWDALVADTAQFIELARSERPGVPVVLLGHSMGSSVAQQYAPGGSHAIDALILSGSTARAPRRDDEPPPRFEPNASFEPARTPFDWLSRDDAEVDKYANDPFCGVPIDWRAASRGTHPALAGDLDCLRQIRGDLPVLFVAGDADPVNRGLTGLHRLEAWYRDAGVRQIDTLYYARGRHEMLNETNRDEVTADIIAWLRRTLSRA
jgi:alpha-beta hydrolase superfamily lysophospholipase